MVLEISIVFSVDYFPLIHCSRAIVIPCHCLTIARDDNSTGPVVCTEGCNAPSAPEPEILKTCLVTYEMKENTDVHHLN